MAALPASNASPKWKTSPALLCATTPRIRQEEVRFILVEAMGRIMPEVTASQAEWVVEHLRSRGIEVLLNTSLDSAEGNLKLINLPDKTPPPVKLKQTPWYGLPACRPTR